MQVKVSAFILPHVGDEYSQCADRFSYDEVNKSFAIADGVGNSLFPGDWAFLLCNDFVEHPDLFINGLKLAREQELIEKWEKIRDSRVENLTEDEKFIFDIGLSKADFAASTFVGLSLNKDGWKCQAIGDSYLFVLGENYELIDKVASMDGKDFDNFPEYFASKFDQHNGSIITRSGNYEGVSFFVLMTDALSDWFLSEKTRNERRSRLLSIDNHQDFEIFINEERQSGNLKDDDTTMLVLKLEEDSHEDFSIIKKNKNAIDIIGELIAKQTVQNNKNEEFIETIAEQNDNSDLKKIEIKRECEKILKEGKESKNKLWRKINKLIEYIYYLLNH